MSVSAENMGNRPTQLRLAAAVVLILAVGACGKKEETAALPGAQPAAGAPAASAPAPAVSTEVAALSAKALREKASKSYQDSRLYAPAGDNAMEYYLALRDKAPGDPGVSSALTDLLPMTVIATEQSRDRGDFAEAQRLYALIEKADKSHPSLSRLKSTIAAAEQTAARNAEQQKLTAEQEQARKEQLEKDRLKQQEAAQQAAAQQLAAQQETAAAAQRDADAKAAAQREADQKAAAQRAAQQAAAPPPAPVAQKPAATASTLRAISTPAPRYPTDALRANLSGEVEIEFTVDADGSVSNARVVRASPPRTFDREAVAAVKRWRFEPVGAPVTTRRTIGFKPGG